MVLVSGTHLEPDAEYRTLRESYRRITIKGSAETPWFEVETPDGSSIEYGNSGDSRVRIMDASQYTPYFQWSINRVTDAFGNTMIYNYHADEMAGVNYPISISYGGASVEFAYLRRHDIEPIDFATVELDQLIQLHTIEVKMNGTLVRDYRMMSDLYINPPITPDSGWRRLTHLQQCGYDEFGSNASCLDHLQFDWMNADNNAMEEIRTAVYKVTDGLGATSEFIHDFIIQNGSNAMLFDERPFGNGILPANASVLSGADGDPLKCVVTELKRDNGLGSTHSTTYAYQGSGIVGDQNWGFLGFYAQRIQDTVSGITTYRQRRLDYPYFGQVSAVRQYNNTHGSHSEVLTQTDTNYGQQSISHGSGNSTVMPYVSTRTHFIHEGVDLLGARQESNAYTFSSAGFVDGITTTTTIGTGVSSSGSPAYWG